MSTVPAGDAELIERLRKGHPGLDVGWLNKWEALCREAADRLVAANERADENWKLAEEERHDANHWRAECEALSARLAEAEREATEDRRLVGDLRARIATLTEALETAKDWIARQRTHYSEQALCRIAALESRTLPGGIIALDRARSAARALLAASPSREPDGGAYDRGRRDVLNAILALNPRAAQRLHMISGGTEEAFKNHAGQIPFDVAFWVTEVAEQLGIKSKDELAEAASPPVSASPAEGGENG